MFQTPSPISIIEISSSSDESGDERHWKRQVPSVCSINEESPDPPGETTGVVPSNSDLQHWWLNVYTRKFTEYRCYDVDGKVLSTRNAVDLLKQSPIKPRVISIGCTREQHEDSSDNESFENSNDGRGSSVEEFSPAEYHIIMMMRADGFATKFKIRNGEVPLPIQEMLMDHTVTIIGFNFEKITQFYKSTIGAFIKPGDPQFHDLAPILKVISSTRSKIFGSVMLRRDIDAVGKAILEQAGNSHLFRPFTMEERTAICFDLHEMLENKWAWVQKLVNLYNGWHIGEVHIWKPETERIKRKKRSGLLGERPGVQRYNEQGPNPTNLSGRYAQTNDQLKQNYRNSITSGRYESAFIGFHPAGFGINNDPGPSSRTSLSGPGYFPVPSNVTPSQAYSYVPWPTGVHATELQQRLRRHE